MDSSTRSLAELGSFLDEQPEPRIVMDTKYRIVFANQAYCREFGQGQPVRGRYCYEVSHRFTVPCDEAGESCPLKASERSGQTQRALHLHHTAHGEEHVDVETTPIRDDEGQVIFFVETMRVVHHASSRPAAEGLVGRSAPFRRMLAEMMRVAPSFASVMLLGETGTGKELVARAIHETSTRSGGPFVVLDCSGLTETLFESELFGHERGAFTGAANRKLGLVESASGGTLFLDEIGDLPLSQQVKLLRLLENGTYRRVGGVETLRADFRLICATHRDLLQMVQAETFRRDLYYRISTFPIHTPSLAERSDDIPLLAQSFLERIPSVRKLRFSRAALDHLAAGRYPGNIRELRNVIERATLLADGDEILPTHLGLDFASPGLSVAKAGEPASGPSFVVTEPIPLDDLEHRYLVWLEGRLPGNRRGLAARLGISERTLSRKMNRQ
ncbi:MAG: sigma-54-dependent Fis family transcriptional regulator [Rhodocyclaceae bacterium]